MKLSRLIVTVVVGLALSQISAAEALLHSGEEQEIAEAVFRYELQQHSSEKRWKVFYLAVGLENPSAPTDEFMRRFDKLQPVVKKFVASEYEAEQMMKEQGLVLGVGSVKMKGETEAQVEGYRFVVPGEAQGFSYEVVLEQGEWIVKSSKATWIA